MSKEIYSSTETNISSPQNVASWTTGWYGWFVTSVQCVECPEGFISFQLKCYMISDDKKHGVMLEKNVRNSLEDTIY